MDDEGAYDFFNPLANTIGYCDYVATGIDAPAAGDPPSYGSFKVTCCLNSQAGACMEPYCDDMVLAAQGTIYKLETAGIEDPNQATTVIQECLAAGNSTERLSRRRTPSPRMAAAMAPRQAAGSADPV